MTTICVYDNYKPGCFFNKSINRQFTDATATYIPVSQLFIKVCQHIITIS